VLQLTGGKKHPLPGNIHVRVQQTRRSFALGACINRWNLDNSNYVKFFLENFNWAVFENEIKWAWTEPDRGKFNYKDADEMVEFCLQNKIPMRGHCIFWEVESYNQGWLKTLSSQELTEAVQNRVVDLLSHYRGKFLHYDVNNEMLHGSFFHDRLGPDIWAYMFNLARQFDPQATLFVNDYHVEDGEDWKSSPQKYLAQIQGLLKQDASIGGIGVQGHARTPIGAILCDAFDKLSSVNIPIWLTEIDVASSNEHVRGDDLEVILREGFAHPGVEGMMLWGFWEGVVSREHGHLVDYNKRVNAAGQRLIALQEEWTTSLTGHAREDGCFQFRGFLGDYDAFIDMGQGEVPLHFKVLKGDGPLVINLHV
jgi:GH35 family endo-1,4-beta-xylanase